MRGRTWRWLFAEGMYRRRWGRCWWGRGSTARRQSEARLNKCRRGGQSARATILLLFGSCVWGADYHFGAVWVGSKVWKDACVTVQKDRITGVGGCGARAVDLKRYTAIPGMIDVHTHMTYVLDNRVSRAGRAAAVPYLAQG